MLAVRFRGAFLWLLAAIFAVIAVPMVVMAQDSTVVTDHTGVLGPVIDQFWPIISAAIASGVLWAIRRGTELTQSWPAPALWAVLYLINLGFNVLAKLLGFEGVDPVAHTWTDGAAVAAAQTVAGAAIYYFGKHKVPSTTA